MSTKIDPTNTSTWQQVGSSVFLLEEFVGRHNTKETANAFSVDVNKYHPSNNTTDAEEIASKICKFLNSKANQKKHLELAWQHLISTVREATGDNPAFNPETTYGIYILNKMRVDLGLEPVKTGNEQTDKETMSKLVDTAFK